MSGSDRQVRAIHEHVHGATQVSAGAPADLLMMALYLFQFIPRMLLTMALQLATTTGGDRSRNLRRSNSSSTFTGDRRVFLSSAVSLLINPEATHKGAAAARGSSAKSDGPFALPRLLRGDPAVFPALRACISRVCDSVYESSLDTCALLLNSGSDAALVRAALGIVAEVRQKEKDMSNFFTFFPWLFFLQLAIISGTMDLPKQCDIVISVLCKYTVRQLK